MPSPSPGGHAWSRFRSIFLSDVHLGSPRAQAELLLDFLSRHQAENLFLVGDIADRAEERSTETWPDAHRAVLEALRAIARAGTRVRYLAGNHDPGFHVLWGTEADLEVALELEHHTADGRRLWIVHGDAFDELLRGSRWLGRLGDGLARTLEGLGRVLELVLVRPHGRLGTRLCARSKSWLGYTSRFERSALEAARLRAVDGIVCGHVHSAASRIEGGLYYGNGGDWVGSASALVEHGDGRMELLRWERAA